MNKEIAFIVCGHGALAQELLKHGEKTVGTARMVSFDLVPDYYPPNCRETNMIPIGIHVGKSGRQLPDFIKYCEMNNVPLIQAATGMKLPEGFKVPIIDAPNLAIPIIAFLKHLPAFVNGITKGIGLNVTDVRLVESHQSTKDSVPGTAKKIASVSGLAERRIASVRDMDIQRLMGVPESNLGRHAYHLLEFAFGDNLRIGLHTKVHGLEPYAAGAIILAQRIAELSPLPEARLYSMTEFI